MTVASVVNADAVSLWCALAGGVGAAVGLWLNRGRAVTVQHLVRDALGGALIGFFWGTPFTVPVIGIDWPIFDISAWSVQKQAGFLFGFTLVCGDSVITFAQDKIPALLEKWGIKKPADAAK